MFDKASNLHMMILMTGLTQMTDARCAAGYYRAGPALEGTACGAGSWCRAGTCVPRDKPVSE